MAIDDTIIDTKKILKEKKRSEKKEDIKVNLTIIDGLEASFGKTYSFFKNIIKIGRDESNDFPINDIKISKFHCEIKIENSEKTPNIGLMDLNSTNGTYVNGQLIENTLLKSGDKIELGDVIIRYTLNDDIEEKYHSKLYDFATTDALTGLNNKRFIMNEIKNQIRISKRNKRKLSLMIIDIDDFKKLNDTYGHIAGDLFLKKTAFNLNQLLREQDIAGRFGGEEFIILLPETGIDGAVVLAERIRKSIEVSEILFEKKSIKTTISIGIAEFNNEKPGELVNNADKELYKAKNSGKNRVSFA
jgi:diguanylate cyclase (GGDEF)-like protein